MSTVLIIEAQIKLYRKPFYERLHAALREDGVQLEVLYSAPPPSEAQKQDNCHLPASYGIEAPGYWFANERLLLQLHWREVFGADLIIIEQANKFIANHLLLPISLLRLKKVAFWGLGQNLQADRSAISEWYKVRTLNWVHGWFAYTEGTARYLRERGVPVRKIFAVQNSVDTRQLESCVKNMSGPSKAALRDALGIEAAAPVGICVGMLHKVKSVPFLIEAGERIRRKISGFQLIVAGGGPDGEEIRHLADDRPWVHFVGPKFGEEKAQLLAIADVFLLPGRVGLAILDGFAAGLATVATRLSIHGPEMEYLEENVNGLLTDSDPEAYAAAVCKVIFDRGLQWKLRNGAALSAEKYSIDSMVTRFRDGILDCLARPLWLHRSKSGDENELAHSVRDNGHQLDPEQLLPSTSPGESPEQDWRFRFHRKA